MEELTQANAPILEVLNQYKANRIVHFDVPGHKGRGAQELRDFLGRRALEFDVNSMKPLDNLCHPVSVIRDAEILAAEAFSAHHAFLIVNGTTAAVQAMILSVVKSGEKIIMPRNVHRSAINAMVLCGAVPVYVNPGTNNELGIPLGMSVSDVQKAIAENPDAKAVLVNNPTYYGVCSNLKEIIRIAHENKMMVLADEAHGAHFYFGESLPAPAMHLGADMAAISMHKTGGSLTQSSFLLTGAAVNEGYVRQVINLMQTTSGSYLLMSSLDIARRDLSMNGKEIFARAQELAEYARREINNIDGYYAFSKELINGDTVFDFDTTKLSINTLNIGLAGIEVYDILRDEYDIQTEFGDLGNLLAIVSAGDRMFEVERLVAALIEIQRNYKKDKAGLFDHEYINPMVACPPQVAFYGKRRRVPIEKSAGNICGEFLMCYPPGIPILAPGERITDEIVDYVLYAKEKGCFMTGPEDMAIEEINVLA